MIRFSGDEKDWPTGVQVITGADYSDMDTWTRRQPDDFGWAYVSIDGMNYCEAVSVTVAAERERLLIREIEWGRP